MFQKFISHGLVWAALVIPFQNLQGWTLLSYSKIPANEVKVEKGALIISVRKSASPIIYKLPETRKVKSFSLDISIAGEMNSQRKDQEFPEDSFFRLGLVVVGEKTLNWFQRQIAAPWVLKLFSLAPQGVGLDKIYFFNLGTDPSQVGKVRAHPKSELIVEEVIASTQRSGDIKLHYTLPSSLEVAALWISLDGDDTGSSFTTALRNLRLE